MTGSYPHFKTLQSAGSYATLALFGILVFTTTGLGQENGTTDETLVHEGISRKYSTHLPTGSKLEKPLALIIALHGATMNGRLLEGQTEFSKLSDRTGEFAVVYPSADPKGGSGFWDFFSPDVKTLNSRRIAEGRDDVGFIAALIDKLVAEKIADPGRVYLTGISNGAFMANRLSLSIPGKISAIAPVAGTIPISMLQEDNKLPPMPILYFHGTEDRFVGIDGTDFITSAKMSLSVSEMINWWSKRNEIPIGAELEVNLPDTDPNDGCRVNRITRNSGKAPVVFYRIKGGGHTWPGGSRKQPEKLLGEICFDINASQLMWEFFKKHPRPAGTIQDGSDLTQ